MIVIINERRFKPVHLKEGDTFSLNYTLFNNISTSILSQSVLDDMIINYSCIFVFTDDMGNVNSNNISGMFGLASNLPDEIRKAERIETLNTEQLENLYLSCPLLIKEIY